jgi:UDPglucose 6-dehydrogenase
MIKYANNSFLATKISFVNEVANICNAVGADVRLISQAIGMDYRICAKFLNPGVGYGGSCFPKDVRALIHTAKEHGYQAHLLNEVDQLNHRQKRVMLNQITQVFGEDLSGKTFCVLGLSFKPKTSDIREAPALVIIKDLLARGATIQAYDPIAMEEAQHEIGDCITYCENVQQAVVNSSAILLITEWDEFRNIDLDKLGTLMKERIVFDGRNIYEPALAREDDFRYFGIGRQ